MATGFTGLLNSAPLLVLGPVVLGLMALAAFCAGLLRKRFPSLGEEGQEGYVVSAVLGLLALLMGFTLSMAVDRFDARRVLVLEEANAIGTTYLRTQLLEQPHRARISNLLLAYTDNRIVLAHARPKDVAPLLAINDRLITDLWTATAAAFPTIKGLDFSSAYLDSMNAVIDLDASRKTARQARVPTEVFAVLVGYLIMTAGVLGYVLVGARGRAAAGFMLILLAAALLLIIDIDRPVLGGIREGQGPMEALRASLRATPAATYDRFLIEDAKAASAAARR